MPNHITNSITLSGNKEKIAEMMENIKNDEVGVGSIDFNKIIPMPESLNIESGSATERGYKAYKDFTMIPSSDRWWNASRSTMTADCKSSSAVGTNSKNTSRSK